MSDEAAKWDAKYDSASVAQAKPAQVLSENLHLLPSSGAALEIAAGLGANACVLAERGLDTSAWDISGAAVSLLQHHARAHDLPLIAEVRDVMALPPTADTFDVIVVSRYLERTLAPKLVAALRGGGLLFYQTFVRDKVDNHGPANPAYRLGANELLELFAGLRVLVYREEGIVGDSSKGFRNYAQFIGMK